MANELAIHHEREIRNPNSYALRRLCPDAVPDIIGCVYGKQLAVYIFPTSRFLTISRALIRTVS